MFKCSTIASVTNILNTIVHMLKVTFKSLVFHLALMRCDYPESKFRLNTLEIQVGDDCSVW